MVGRHDRKDQILEVATRLFAEHGYDQVSIKHISEECGITEPAVYRHFPSKAAIFTAVLDSLPERLKLDGLEERLVREHDIEPLLQKLTLHIIDFYVHNEDCCRLLFYSTLDHHKKAQKVFDAIRGRYVRLLVTQLDRLYRAKRIVKKNNVITARCFVGMVFECAMGQTVFRGMQGKVFKAEDVVKNNVPIYARGLAR